MTETLKYGSNLYLPDKPYYKMTMEELVNHTKICKSLDKTYYKKILHTGDIDTSIIPTLIQNGIISVDYLLWERGEGWKNYTSKSGFDFLWKIQNKNKNLLFKFNKIYELS